MADLQDRPINHREDRPTSERHDTNGLALALTMFIMSIILYLQPPYFQAGTAFVAGLLTVVGFGGLGVELGAFAKDERVYKNIGIGAALFMLWLTIYTHFSRLLLNVFIFPLLMLGVYGLVSGLMNIFFALPLKPDQLTSKDIRRSLLTMLTGTIGFVASVIQILQFIKWL